jgi:hypothetical protein
MPSQLLDRASPIGALSVDRVRATVGSEFLIDRGTTKVRARLAEVVDGHSSDRVSQHSLIFTTDAAFDDGTYRFTHAELGAFELFVVSIGARGEAVARYQVCLSRVENS